MAKHHAMMVAEWRTIRKQAELDILMDVYASGSASATRIAARAPLLENMFLDFVALGIDVRNFSDWDAALWARSRVNSGTKTAGSMAKTALILAERFTGEFFFADSPLVKEQVRPLMETRASSDPPKPAIPLKWHHVEALETTIKYGTTVQQRVMSGFFAFLVHTSHRTANGQRTRKLHLAADALMGESLLKGRATWTKWAAARKGLAVDDWAAPWMEELFSCGLPGADFIVLAPNSTLDEWLPRPAEYRDFSRALHLLLMLYGGESPRSVIEFTPHSCRHVQVTAGAQLASRGFLDKASLDTLGHWEKGSKMPERYDSASCVTELQTRSTIADALRTGWRPSADGNLPAPITPAMEKMMAPGTPMARTTTATTGQLAEPAASSVGPGKILTVVNLHRKRAHRVKPPRTVTMCNFWTCGSLESPAAHAKFGEVGKNKRCGPCFGVGV